jgi:hypothetical protein
MGTFPMNTHRILRHLVVAAALALTAPLHAAVDAALQAKLEPYFVKIEAWAADPTIVQAVAAQNTTLPAASAELTQEKWKALTVLDPIVRAFTKNPAADVLKANKAPWLAEAFISDASGKKVAFLNKTTNWSHAGKAKHDEPMKGNHWTGEVELDQSSGQQQVQIAVPVLEQGKPIGSLVVGIAISKLE